MNNLDLYELAEKENIMIDKCALPKNKALSVKIGQSEFIGIDVDVADDSAQERTLLAHELGHCMTGAFYDIGATDTDRRKAEYKAARWSVVHCVPKTELINLIAQGYSRSEIAELFGVSEPLVQEAYTFYFDYGIAC